MDYKILADTYQLLETHPKRLEKTYYVACTLKNVPDTDIEYVIQLLQGRVFPRQDTRKIGMAAQLVVKTIHIAYSIDTNLIIKNWKETGDLGLTAQILCKNKQQKALFSRRLSVQQVYSTLSKIAEMDGSGSVDRKIKEVAGLLTSAEPLEAKFITRTVLEILRVGIGEGILRDAIAWAYTPPIAGIFSYCADCGEFLPPSISCTCSGNHLPLRFDDIIAVIKARFKPGELAMTDLYPEDDKGILAIIPSDEQAARAMYNDVVSRVQRAIDLTNDYALVSDVLKRKGLTGLAEITLTIFIPLKVMLAQKVATIDEGFNKVGTPAAFEYKYDGFRMQIHKQGFTIRIFTRRLEEVTFQFPDVVQALLKYVKAESCILDAEAVGIDYDTGQYIPFQNISQRIRRKYDIEEIARQFPVEVNVFDVLYLNGKDLLSLSYNERRDLLKGIVQSMPKKVKLSEQIVTDDIKEAHEFYETALKIGYEGVMIKRCEGLYRPGLRVGEWLKVKPTMENLDVVVVGAEWGKGKRVRWLTSYVVACRDDNDQLVVLGKVSSGLAETEGQTFQLMTELLKPHITKEAGRTVTVRPKIVIEVAYEEIQKSPSYTSGYALRFPRVVRIRDDRDIDDIATLDMVHEFYLAQVKVNQRSG